MNQKKQLMKNTIIIAIGKLSTQIISYLLLPLYTSQLDPSEYGNYDFICTLSVFLCPIITLLMEESMFRYLIDADSKVQRKKIITQTIIYTFFGTVLFTIIAALIMGFGTDYTAMYITAIITFVISNILIGLSNALSRGLGKIKLYSVSNFILGISTIILNIVFILALNAGAEGLLWANTIANAFTAIVILGILKLPKYIGKIDKPLMKDMIKYSIPLVPNSISWSIINMSDRIILTQMVSSAANGIYAMANKFPNIINVLYGYFYTAWKESAAKIVKEDNKNQYYNSIYHDAKRFLYAVTICLIAVMPFAFPIFINEAYDEAYVYIPIVMIATYYSNLSSFYGGIFSAYKDTKIMGTTTIVAAVINLVIDLLLVNSLKIYAACFSTLIANLIVYFYRKKKLKKYLKLKELKWQGPMLFLAIICLAYYAKYIPVIGNNPVLLWTINVISLVIAVLYSLLNNWKFIKGIINTIKGKFNRKDIKEN
mgnify:FL=1